MEKRKIIDLCIIGFFVVLAAFITIHFKTNVTISTSLYYILPIIYLLIRGKFNYKKIFFTTFIWVATFGILDLITYANKGWWVPTEQLWIIKYRIFGLSPLLEIVWFAVFILFILLFYEHFVDTRETKKISKNFKGALLIFFITVILLIILLLTGTIDKIKYAYLFIWGIYLIPPIIYLVIKKIHFVKKFFFVLIPITIINLVYELTGVPLEQWIFPGQYIGEITLFGISFPLEEFFLFIILSSISLLSYYELFFDDMK